MQELGLVESVRCRDAMGCGEVGDSGLLVNPMWPFRSFFGRDSRTAICSKVACQKKPCCRTAMGLVGNFCHFGPVVLCFVPFSGMLILSCWNRVTGGWIMMMHPSPKKLWVLGFAGSQAICSQQLQPREFGNRSSFVVESSYQRNSDQTNY